MTSNFARTVGLLAFLSLSGLVACAPDAEEGEGAVRVAAVDTGITPRSDCPTILNRCYVDECQAMQPSPTQQCFLDCTESFYACLAQADVPVPVRPIILQ